MVIVLCSSDGGRHQAIATWCVTRRESGLQRKADLCAANADKVHTAAHGRLFSGVVPGLGIQWEASGRYLHSVQLHTRHWA
jgi:hypothetical protein